VISGNALNPQAHWERPPSVFRIELRRLIKKTCSLRQADRILYREPPNRSAGPRSSLIMRRPVSISAWQDPPGALLGSGRGVGLKREEVGVVGVLRNRSGGTRADAISRGAGIVPGVFGACVPPLVNLGVAVQKGKAGGIAVISGRPVDHGGQPGA